MQSVSVEILKVVLPLLATTIAALLVAILRKYLKKIDIELDVKQEEVLRQAVIDAIKSTNETARRNGGLTSEQKIEMTVQAIKQIRPDLPIDDIAKKVDTLLHDVRVTEVKKVQK